jgi:hypothetical protein
VCRAKGVCSRILTRASSHVVVERRARGGGHAALDRALRHLASTGRYDGFAVFHATEGASGGDGGGAAAAAGGGGGGGGGAAPLGLGGDAAGGGGGDDAADGGGGDAASGVGILRERQLMMDAFSSMSLQEKCAFQLGTEPMCARSRRVCVCVCVCVCDAAA